MNPPELPNRIASVLCLDDASYVLGSLSPADRQAYEEHLATCPICQASVGRLAGIPGLLALTSVEEIESEPPPVPELLLPRLLAATSRQRRRRRLIWSGTLVAAAACVVALVISLMVRPTAPNVENQALPTPQAMQPVIPGPMAVSLQLVDKQWGTSIVVTCRYDGAHHPGYPYELVAYDAAGKPEKVGGWMSVSGAVSTVTTSTFLRRSEISRLEVQEQDGTPLMRAVPHA